VPLTHWHLRITLESSAKEQIQGRADAERRSAANYVRVLIEQAAAREQEAAKNDPR